MLGPSVVISKVGTAPQRIPINQASPDIIVSPGSGTASVAVYGPNVTTATVDNFYTPGTWVAATNPTAVAANARRAFRLNGVGHVPLVVTWS
jgi:hypothetical protein